MLCLLQSRYISNIGVRRRLSSKPFKQWVKKKCLPPKDTALVPSQLIGSLGFDFPMCGRDHATNLAFELLDKRFANKHSTDRNLHPIAVIAGSPGMGKTRLTIELPNILNSYIEQREYNINKFIPIIFTYNNGNPLCDLDYSLPIQRALSLRVLHAFSKTSESFVDFAHSVPKSLLSNITLKSTFTEIVSHANSTLINKDKIQGIYLGLDEFNRLVLEKGDVVDTSYLHQVSIYDV